MCRITRHCCIRAHSWYVAECRGELAAETGGPLHSSTLHWPTLWRRFTWHQHACQKLVGIQFHTRICSLMVTPQIVNHVFFKIFFSHPPLCSKSASCPIHPLLLQLLPFPPVPQEPPGSPHLQTGQSPGEVCHVQRGRWSTVQAALPGQWPRWPL